MYVELLTLYIIGALATGIVGLLYLNIPAYNIARKTLPKDHAVVKTRYIIYVLLLIANTLVAPMVLIVYLSDSASKLFINTLASKLAETEPS